MAEYSMQDKLILNRTAALCREYRFYRIPPGHCSNCRPAPGNRETLHLRTQADYQFAHCQ